MVEDVKKPLPGEWWVSEDDKENAFICGYDVDGDPVFQTDETSPARIDRMLEFLESWRHVPDCTGFDWSPPVWVDLPREHVLRRNVDQYFNTRMEKWCIVDRVAGIPVGGTISGKARCLRKDLPETYPQYYTNPDGFADDTVFVKRTSATAYETVNVKGEITSKGRWEAHCTAIAAIGGWTKVPEAEALALLDKPVDQPQVESPDDWVELPPEHILRADVDQFYVGCGYGEDGWLVVKGYAGIPVGMVSLKRARCRRKDLPDCGTVVDCEVYDHGKTVDPLVAKYGEPEQGWRWLADDEKVEEGDECKPYDKFVKSGNFVEERKQSRSCRPYRRRVRPAKPTLLVVDKYGKRYELREVK